MSSLAERIKQHQDEQKRQAEARSLQQELLKRQREATKKGSALHLAAEARELVEAIQETKIGGFLQDLESASEYRLSLVTFEATHAHESIVFKANAKTIAEIVDVILGEQTEWGWADSNFIKFGEGSVNDSRIIARFEQGARFFRIEISTEQDSTGERQLVVTTTGREGIGRTIPEERFDQELEDALFEAYLNPRVTYSKPRDDISWGT